MNNQMPTITSPSNDPHNMKMSLLVIDDDPIVCELVERIAKNEGIAVQALQSAKNLTPQMLKGHKLVLLDLMMPETDGVQVMNVLKAAENPPKLILISGVGAQGPGDAQSYGYSGQVCSSGASGSVTGFDPGPGSFFFLLVGNDGAGVEGSYGTNGVGRGET